MYVYIEKAKSRGGQDDLAKPVEKLVDSVFGTETRQVGAPETDSDCYKAARNWLQAERRKLIEQVASR